MIDSYSVHPINVIPLDDWKPGLKGWAPVEEGKHTHWAVLHDTTQFLRAFFEDHAAARLKAEALNSRNPKGTSHVQTRPDLRRDRLSQDPA